MFKTTVFVFSCAFLGALPQNPSIHLGEASFHPSDGVLRVEASDRTVINWDAFQIETGEVVQFIQPNSASTSINRVISARPTEIFGSLISNGHICLINQNGILVSKDAILNVGALTASTFDIHTDAFFAQKEFTFKTDSRGTLVHQGVIRASQGNVVLNAPYVKLGETSLIDVSGACGGSVSIGSKDSIHTFLEPGSRVFADGLEGNGGKVIVWADQATSFHGFISAKGNQKGGFIEISSPGYLDYRGQIDLSSAPGGEFGTLLLDPTDITIDAGMTTAGVVFGNPTTLPATTPVNILASDLTTALNAGNVRISTTSAQAGTGNISITTGFGWTGNTFLQLDAENDITVNALISPTGTFAGDQVFLNATGALRIRTVSTGASVGVTTSNGGIRLAGSAITIGNVIAGLNESSLVQANGANGNITINSGTNLTLQGGNAGNLANVFVEAARNMTVTAGGAILLDGGSGLGPGAGPKVDLTVLAGGAAQNITASSILVRSGSGTFCRSQILSGGTSQTITLTGDLTIQGGSGTTGDAAVSANVGGNVQTIRANNINILGGNTGTANPASIINNGGAMTLIAPGQVLLQGGATDNSSARINGAPALSLQMTAGRLDVLGGNGNSSPASVGNINTEVFNIATSVRVIASQNGATVSSGASISTSSGALQMNCQSLRIEAGPGMIEGADVSSIGALTVVASGPIEIFSVLNAANQADLRGILGQNITASSINQQGKAYLGVLVLLVPSGNQILNVSGNHTLQARAGGFNPSVVTLSTASQFATIGGDLLIQSAAGSTATWSKGAANSTLNVGGNSSLLGNGGTVTMTGGASNTFITNGNLTTNAGVGGAMTVTLGASSSVRTGLSAFLGTAAKTGRDTFTLGAQSTFAVGQNLTAIAGSGGVICQTTVTIGAAGTGSSNGQFVTGGSASFRAGSVANATCGVTIFGSGTASVGQDLFIFGGSANGANGFIQSSPNTALATTLFSVNVGRDIVVQGGTAGTAQGFILTTRGSQKVSAGRDISIVGGTGSATNIAVIGGGFTVSGAVSDTATSAVQAVGNITLTNRAGKAYVDTLQAGKNTSNPGSVTVHASGNITLSTGIATSEVAQTTLDSHPISVESDHAFAAGALWAANGDPFLSSTPLATTSSATTQNSRGGFVVDTGITGGGISFTSQKGDIYLSSADHFVNGNICDLTIGPATTLNNLTVTSISGDISIDPFHNIIVTNGVTTLGTVFMIAQNDIQFTATGFITAGSDVTLVVDNQAPRSPLIGLGAFQTAVGSTITSGGLLRIYTARQSQNSILGLLNGLTFAPGALFVDTAQEVWCTYYPTPIPGLPFTISYKDCLTQIATQATIVVTEFLLDLHAANEFPGWDEMFVMMNRIDDYKTLPDQKFLLSRRLSKILNQPKSYTHFNFAP